MKISKSDLRRLSLAMESKNLTINQVIKTIENDGVIREGLSRITDDVFLEVDYTKTVEQVIAGSNYEWKVTGINSENFPISPEMVGKKVVVSAAIFWPNYDISSEEIVSELDKVGYRPATLMELLFLRILFPRLQGQFIVVAPGSIWCDDKRSQSVPYLDVVGFKYGLGLVCPDDKWGNFYYFLAVLK